MEQIIAGIDVGTTKICTVVADTTEPGNIRVLGVGVAPSRGLRRGTVVDIGEATQSIAQSIAEAERLSGQSIQSAYVSVSTAHISSLNSRGATVVGRGDRKITQDDMDRAVESAQTIAIPHNRQVLHAIARSFTLDGQDGIRDPLGLVGYRLEVETHIVTAATTAIRNLVNCVKDAGVDVEELVLQSLAAAEAVLRPEEKKMGVVLVDVGGGTTDIAIFIEDSVWHTAVLEVGGHHLTNDIAIVLRTPFETAEELKTRHGCAIVDAVDAQEHLSVNTFGDGLRQLVSCRDLAEIIAARAEQILDMVHREIKRSGYDGLLPAGIVLTGGTAELEGFKELAMRRLDLPVRIGTEFGLSGMVAKLNSPAFAAAAGLVLWGARYGRSNDGNYDESGSWKGFLGHIANWFKTAFLAR